MQPKPYCECRASKASCFQMMSNDFQSSKGCIFQMIVCPQRQHMYGYGGMSAVVMSGERPGVHAPGAYAHRY